MIFLKPFFLKYYLSHKENQVKPKKMQTRKIAYLFLILLGVFMLNACEYDKIQPEELREAIRKLEGYRKSVAYSVAQNA